MNIQINKNYIKYISTVIFTLLDSALLCLVGQNYLAFAIYIILNVVTLTMICAKKEPEPCVSFAIIFMLFYTFFVDAYVHYFKLNIIFEAEFIYILPLIMSCLKTKNRNSKWFVAGSFLYIILNFFIMLLSNKVPFMSYFLAIINVITFLGFYYVFNNVEFSSDTKDLYKFIFIISAMLTLFQTAIGFHNDTRNGLFSVFGWGANTFFIMFYLVYNYTQYLLKKIKLKRLAFCIVLCVILYICTESKAALVMVFITMIGMTFITRGFSVKKILLIILAVAMLPLAYQMLIKYNPKFAYLTNVDKIVGYYFGNNDRRYQYGRFTAIQKSYESLSPARKVIGMGFGSATPLYHVFYEELGRETPEPYYITKYGYFYGFQNTTIGSALLDGGLILVIIITAFIIFKFIVSIINVKKNNSNITGYMQFGIYMYFIYIFIYANLFKDFRYMAVAGIILGMKNLSLTANSKELEK